ncbi:efflux RND transporter permease subunit [Botrimarina hoheduenensis]|uniref:Cobalt-zinc-cadmium resistance protein CzcA n=1 Tax=Botrimarina hoheduenensis TaxID=2528000 RepID=A0A5C5W9K4_9BACT|nr:efflux RND transporter permease subunit [Botrimarina hoheduenensis]TWT46875.1 Cobalt-zinc-cadmium resistance protein CzcA [Botrimarina hoheduenensis]
MLNAVIRFSLHNRLLVLCASVGVLVLGAMAALSLPIDVLPDLTRPRVAILVECPGMAPEEVEQLVTFPIETAVNGAGGVVAVRSQSDIGLAVINVEFDWGADIYTARQIVQERLDVARSRLPPEVRAQLGPVSSLLGQIQLLGMWSERGEISPLEVRTLADWQVRRRLLTIPGISQVITMGGGRKQVQVLADYHLLHQYGVSLEELERALQASNLNVTGGYLNRDGRELLVRGIGRLRSLDDVRSVVVKSGGSRPVLVQDVARVVERAQVKRGDSSVNGREAVVLTIQKQPGADTRWLTAEIERAVAELRPAMPADVRIDPSLYRQREFIDYGVSNVIEALRDGSVLVFIVLLIFLVNLRTTFITLTAIPLSILVTALVFRWMGLSINVMTLGGIAVALGELVDDAIVDVENIFRRLRENRLAAEPRSALAVVFDASSEVRGAIITSTVLVILVFAPLFALSGMEGRLFTPLGVAYVVSILASTVVSLTVTPVLSYYLLPRARAIAMEQEGWLLRQLKRAATPLIRFSTGPLGIALGAPAAGLAVLLALGTLLGLGRNFLPPFNEGAAQLNLFAAPGTSLETSRRISQMADERLSTLLATPEHPDNPLLNFTCRTGRAEQDEHVMGVNVSEYVMSLNPDSPLSRAELIEELTHAVEDLPGVEHEVEQPIAHLISHMLSGVTAQIAIKVYGEDLTMLRTTAETIRAAIAPIEGIAEPVVEQQQQIPQLRVELLRDQLALYGVSAQQVQSFVETAMNGRVVSQILEGDKAFDLLLRMDDPYREAIDQLDRLVVELPDGREAPLAALARVYEASGPNTITREDTQRRIVVRVNTAGLDLASAVEAIQQRIAADVTLPEGYFVTYGGLFEAQRVATQRIVGLGLLSIVVVFFVLYAAYPSVSIVSQILLSLPAAMVGGVAALVLTGQDLSVAGMVGFISLGGIAARNGLLLVSTYLDRSREIGQVTREAILQGSLDRLAPVLMTTLTTGLALVPLVLGGDQPGKEILMPVATVIVGGLVSSTLCEFLLRPGLFWSLREDTHRLLALSAEE